MGLRDMAVLYIAILRLPQHLACDWQRTCTFVLPNIEKRREIVLSGCGLHCDHRGFLNSNL